MKTHVVFQAAIGIADLLCMAMIQEGLTEEEAQKQIWMVDIDGLLTIVSSAHTFTYSPYQYTTYLPIRDWSLITGRGITTWENRGSETFCAPPPPHSRQGKTFCAPPPPPLF